MLDFEKEIDICVEQMAMYYDISENTARQIIYDYNLEDQVIEDFKEAIKEKEEQLEREARYESEHYADGWSDHEGV